MSEFETIVDPLLEELELDIGGLRVVALGGGHGLAQALMAIQEYGETITAVVSVADDGGSSGRLVPGLGIPPPGDTRRALLALSPGGSLWRRVMEHRFEHGDVAGHSLGNLVLAAFAEMSGGLEEALNTMGRLMGARGAVVPVASEPLVLEAVIDGKAVSGQAAISRSRGSIEDLRVTPAVTATRAALAAIGSAEQIVIGPGSLYTSLAAVLVVPGVVEAVNASAAGLVYVCNLITQDGETLGMDAAAHVAALVERTGLRRPDVVVGHHGPLEVPAGLQRVEVDETALGCRVESAELADPGAAWPQHDPARLGAVLRRLA
ncbi:MAG: uridine diphosphate-N-acetylglucosamine-binding protein YvcK [Actinobacteria bacterium]|nr:uridine diphosphate-N-acetylglucosamine-binding protein YvcK [Actinomycetota bacterium]MBU1494407.1 uridine diphosphate-N-acetylglucosamine-binding protein YvcK [Actinomycetota bacterium]MBU1866256.1 uridine diphosphate-N-acetylglucosamine-binding protein YvcK [Actinomycetota bacterium]